MQTCWFTLLPLKSRKRLARDVLDSFATHAGLVYDVTDTDCWHTQKKKKEKGEEKKEHLHLCFRDFQTSTFTDKPDEKFSENCCPC